MKWKEENKTVLIACVEIENT